MLMEAAMHNQNPEVIAALLKAGADAKAKDLFGKTALNYAQGNADQKDTDAFRKLEKASR
jgi:ankyrin repeat protein